MKVDFAVMLNLSEAIIELVVERYPELLIFGSGVSLAWLIAVRWERFYGRFKTTEGQSNTIGDVHLPDLHSKHLSMERKLNSIDTTMQKIELFLTTKFGVDSSTFRGKSPMQLTEGSQDVLVFSGGKNYVDRRMPQLLTLVEKENPKSGLDIEDTCHMVLLEKSRDDDEFVPIKDYVFRNPVYIKNGKKIWLSLPVMIRIMAIYLRDHYMQAGFR